MNYHVFVVDSTSFKIHLEYLFAGTGAGNKICPFLLTPNDHTLHWATESGLVSMISDISRIRPEDKVLFYLQAKDNKPGKFFGVFKATSLGFFDENNNNNYLKDELGKGLSFRIKLAHDTVYPEGVSEHEVLDDLSDKKYPYQLCWSLIYRKLSGKRGCTMITPYEFSDILTKLKNKNNGRILDLDYFTFDSQTATIVNSERDHPYLGYMTSLDIKQRLVFKATANQKFEAHLQAFIMQNYDTDPLSNYILSLNNGSAWVGNEVRCSVGEQKIDTMIIEENDCEIHIKVVEYKCIEPYDRIIDGQLPWYLRWTYQYVVPNLMNRNKAIKIHPCILAKCTDDQNIINRIRNEELLFINEPYVVVEKTEYIGFSIENDQITFSKIV